MRVEGEEETLLPALRRVVITGVAALSSAGLRIDDLVAAVKAQRSCVQAMPEWQRAGLDSQVAACPPEPPLDEHYKRRKLRRLSAEGRYALWAVLCALQAAHLGVEALQSPKMGLFLGSAFSGLDTCAQRIGAIRSEGAMPRAIGANSVGHVLTSAPAACVSAWLQTRGPASALNGACATSMLTLAGAWRRIQLGEIECAAAGGAEAVTEELAYFLDPIALSSGFNDSPERACRPFDADRDGMIIGGGAGVLIVESLDSALRRDAPIIAEVLALAENSSGPNLTGPGTEGQRQVMEMALSRAGVSATEVDHIDAHATSTPDGDLSEATAIAQLLERAGVSPLEGPTVSSIKGVVGHPGGAGSAIEIACCCRMLSGGFVAGNTNLVTVDPELPPLRLPKKPIEQRPRVILSNSFGFGRVNASCVLKAWEDAA